MSSDRETGVRKSGSVVLVYKDKEGVVGLRIAQSHLERVHDLECLAASAREELLEYIEQGLTEETGELVLDRSSSSVAKIVIRRPARAREGRPVRRFVLSSRERLLLRDWKLGENVPSHRVERTIARLLKRSWVTLRRECCLIRKEKAWDELPQMLRRERTYYWGALKLRSLLLLHKLKLIDGRSQIVETAGNMFVDFQRETP
jgi:hypothetical protein